jgi:hypothetical protein
MDKPKSDYRPDYFDVAAAHALAIETLRLWMQRTTGRSDQK